MKHQAKVTIILIVLFSLAQLVGLYVAQVYHPVVVSSFNNETQEYVNQTNYQLPYGFNPPQNIRPATSVIQILIALAIAVLLTFILIKFRAEIIMRIWFFVVVIIGIALSLNAFFFGFSFATVLAILIAIPLAYMKVFRRNMVVHNFTELLIYPGIAAVFIPLLSIWSGVVLLILISAYDIYAVWHAGFMQKMARYQIEKVRVFSGFYIPYMTKKDRALILESSKNSKNKGKKVPVQIAILGGGDVVFPIIMAGIAIHTMGLYAALCVTLGSIIALSYLFYISEKGRFYPAMPFISAGCLLGLGVAYLL